VCSVLVAGIPLPGVGQAPPSNPAKPTTGTFALVAIKVTGSTHYKPEEVIAASGLQTGQNVSEDDFKRASQRLGETGAFSDVAYRYEYSPAGATVQLEVSDNAQLVPVYFYNFVWFTDSELAEQLRQRVPLYQGQLPLGGSMADEVSDGLQALLIEHHIEGRADYLHSGDLNGPIDAITFAVSGPNIRIRNVGFEGVAPSELPPLQTAAAKLNGAEYSRSLFRAQTEKNFLPVYLERGYLKAAFSNSQAKVAEENSGKVLVDVVVPVDPGLQYNLVALQWSGNKVFPSDKLDPLVHLAAGKPANAVQLDEDVSSVQKLYGTLGYMAAHIKPVPQMDDQKRTVVYQLQVQEGEVYHMGELEIRGVDTPTSRRLVLAWQLREGAVYDASYPARFLKDTAGSIVNPSQWEVTVQESVEDKDKTVDVTLKLDPKPTR